MILGLDYFEASDATVFYFNPTANDFDSIADKYQPLWKKLDGLYGKEYFGDEFFKRFTAALLKKHPNLVVFGCSSYEIVCGPISNAIYLCIDFAYGCEEPK